MGYVSPASAWEKESDLRDFVRTELEKKGWKLQKEVSIDDFRIDLVGEYISPRDTTHSGTVIFGNVRRRVAIEVKVDRGTIGQAITKCWRIGSLPDFDEVYVAFPAIFFGEGIRDQLNPAPVGAILAGKDVEIVSPRWNHQPANLGIRWDGPSSVRAGDVVEFRLLASNASNVVGKAALGVTFVWKPSGPLRRARGEKNRKIHDRLDPGENASIPFTMRIASNAKPGKYPVYYSVSSRKMTLQSSYQEVMVVR